MVGIKSLRPSPAMIVAVIALVASFGGAAMAINKGAVKTKHIAKNAVKSKQIAKNAVKSRQIAKNAVKSRQIASEAVTTQKLGADAVTGDKVDESTLGPVPAVRGLQKFALTKVAPSADAASDAAAREAATPIEIYSHGPLRIYAKCFRNTSIPGNPVVNGELIFATTEPGAVYAGAEGDSGNTFINPGTPEVDRLLLGTASAAGPDPGTLNISESQWAPFWAAQGNTYVNGQAFAGTKVGSPTAGNGVFGPGDVCIFGGFGIAG